MPREKENEILTGNFFKYVKPVSKYAPFVIAGGVMVVTRDFNMAVGAFVV